MPDKAGVGNCEAITPTTRQYPGNWQTIPRPGSGLLNLFRPKGGSDLVRPTRRAISALRLRVTRRPMMKASLLQLHRAFKSLIGCNRQLTTDVGEAGQTGPHVAVRPRASAAHTYRELFPAVYPAELL